MKKLLLIISLSLLISVSQKSFAQRFISEIFTSVDSVQNIIYGSNWQFLGTPTLKNLVMDVYTPHGDTAASRPLVIMIHTGSFLPVVINNSATGDMRDSTIVEMCTRFAKRGYTAVSMDYRAGWNPSATGTAGQDIRTGTLLQAVYRAIQDAKACVRYFKKDVATMGNTYKVDTTQIILGGMGSGGYVALAYVTLNNPAQISLPKFIAGQTDTTYAFTAGYSYVNQAVWGDFDGYAGATGYNNPNNSVGYAGDVQMIFSCGGALGDKSWLVNGVVPMVCFHVPNDPYAPVDSGTVIVPTTGDPVVYVWGSRSVDSIADALGNNNSFASFSYYDPYSTRANSVNGGIEGYCPFELPSPGPPLYGQAAPWEWFDSTALKNISNYLYGSTGPGMTAYTSSIYTNPDMSKAKALAYIDTIMGYFNPRAVNALGLHVGIDEISLSENSVSVFPNPSVNQFTIRITNENHFASSLEITDALGRVVKQINHPMGNTFVLKKDNLEEGVYFIKVRFDNGDVTKKITLQ